MESFKVLHLLNHVEEIGNGIVNTAVDIACGQASLGHRVAVASAGGSYVPLLARFGVEHYVLDQAKAQRPSNMPGALIRLRAILKAHQPDIVHCHMMTGLVLARFWSTFSRIRLVSQIHNVHQRSSVLMGLAERVIPVSTAVADDMARRGVPKAKMRVVVNGTLGSPRLPELSGCDPAPLRRPAIVTVAGMTERKGISELIEAFARIAPAAQDAHLYLVGEGDARAQFEAQAAATSVASRIHFVGFQRNPKSYLRSTDIFVLASRRESFGIALLEAREAGCAIIASDVDGIPEALDFGRAGMLIPPGDASALAEALLTLLRNPARRASLAAAALNGLDRFNYLGMTTAVLDVYRELLRGR